MTSVFQENNPSNVKELHKKGSVSLISVPLWFGFALSGQRLHCLDNCTQQLSSKLSSHWLWPVARGPKTHLQKLYVQGINFSITLLIHRVRGLLLLFGSNQHVVVIIHSKALLINRCNGERERCQIKTGSSITAGLRLLGYRAASSPQAEWALPLQHKKAFAKIVSLNQVQRSFFTFPSCLFFPYMNSLKWMHCLKIQWFACHMEEINFWDDISLFHITLKHFSCTHLYSCFKWLNRRAESWLSEPSTSQITGKNRLNIF